MVRSHFVFCKSYLSRHAKKTRPISRKSLRRILAQPHRTRPFLLAESHSGYFKFLSDFLVLKCVSQYKFVGPRCPWKTGNYSQTRRAFSVVSCDSSTVHLHVQARSFAIVSPLTCANLTHPKTASIFSYCFCHCFCFT